MTILIAYDGSADSRAAVEFAAKHLTAQPTLIVTVWEPLLVQLKRYPLAGAGLLADPGEGDEWRQV